MFETNSIDNSSISAPIFSLNRVNRLTALWAFSEAALGGILHALKIPLTGLFIGGAAVIFISLIAYYSEKKHAILRATLLVVIVKFVVAPYTPINAYFSVFVEAIFGFLLFSFVGYYKIAAILLGIFSLLFSALQKVFILTIVFGNTLWESIDIFSNFIIKQFFLEDGISLSFSYLLIGIYITIHVTGGIITGIIGGKLPLWIENFSGEIDYSNISNDLESDSNNKKKRRRKGWFQKKTGIALILFSTVLILLSYISPEMEKNLALRIIVMFIRSILITLFWFVIVSPLAMKLLQKFLNNKKSTYSTEVENIVELIPHMKAVVNYSWRSSKTLKGFSRIKAFLSYLFVIILKE